MQCDSDARLSAETVRNMLSYDGKTERQPCYICGMHQPITEIHHVIPISELTKMVNEGLVELHDVSTPIVWLCPNCHRYVHSAEGLPQNEEKFEKLLKSFFEGTKRSSKSYEVAERLEHLLDWRYDAESNLLESDDTSKGVG